MTIIVLSAGPIQLLLGLPVPDSIELFATRRIWKAKWHPLLFFLSPLSIIFPSFSWVPNSFHSFRRKGKTGCRRLKKRCSFLFFFFFLAFSSPGRWINEIWRQKCSIFWPRMNVHQQIFPVVKGSTSSQGQDPEGSYRWILQCHPGENIPPFSSHTGTSFLIIFSYSLHLHLPTHVC